MTAAYPLLKNDFVYDVVKTNLMDFPLTLRTIKLVRLQLRDIRSRLGTGKVRYELPGGPKLEFDLSIDQDAFMYDYLTRFGHYEREVEQALSGLITKETTFVDVGANVGYFTVMFSRSARAVYAIEPVPAVFERLKRNLELNGLSNVEALPLAAGREDGKLRLFESRISPGHDSAVKRFEHDKSILVDSVRLDRAVDPQGDVVMKVDVEGAEKDVLLGAAGLFRSGRISAVVLEWARGIYPRVTDVAQRFSLYASLGEVEVLDGPQTGRSVSGRDELPEFCNLLIRVRR